MRESDEGAGARRSRDHADESLTKGGEEGLGQSDEGGASRGRMDPEDVGPENDRKGRAGFFVETTEHRRQGQLEQLNWIAEPGSNLRKGETAGGGKADLLVVSLEPHNVDKRLEDLQQYRDEGGKATLIFLLGQGLSTAQIGWATLLSIYCLSPELPPPALARCVDEVSEYWRHRQTSEVVEGSLRRVVIRVGEGMEVDTIPIRMGAAPRNFLSLLAHRPNTQLSKVEDVTAGQGCVVANECRRRLGKAIGKELVELLIDGGGRGGFYRLRSQAEITATCRDDPHEHPWTEVEIRRPKLQY